MDVQLVYSPKSSGYTIGFGGYSSVYPSKLMEISIVLVGFLVIRVTRNPIERGEIFTDFNGYSNEPLHIRVLGEKPERFPRVGGRRQKSRWKKKP